MKREEATEEIKRIKQGMQGDFGWNKSGIEALDMAIEALQTESCGKDINVPTTDAISRQAVIEQTYNWSKDEFLRTTNAFDHLRRKIKALPSVQSTVCIAKISFDDQQMKEMMDKAISNLDFSDLISRQEVLDACNQSLNILEATERIKDLPSVQPEYNVGHWIYIDDDCELYDSYKCSKCKRQITVDTCRKDDIGFVIEDMEFCPRCGERMEVIEDAKNT